MLLLGLDVSQRTGWCLYDPSRDLKDVRSGVLRATGDSYEAKAADLGRQLVGVIKQDRPDFAAIEQPLRIQPGTKRKVKFMGEEADDKSPGGGLNAVISSNQMVGSCSSILGAYQIQFETLSSSQWRKLAYGFGTKPGWGRPDWKRHAKQQAARVGLDVKSDDEAEAIWIAFAGAGTQQFKMLQLKAEQEAA